MNHFQPITWTTIPGFEVMYSAFHGLYMLRRDGVTKGPLWAWDLNWAAEHWGELA